MDKDQKDPVALVEKANAAVTEIKETVTALDTELRESVSENAKDVKEAVEITTGLAEKVTGLASQILDLEQGMADAVTAGKAPIESLGEMVVNSEQFKDFAAGNSQKMSFQANTIIGQEGSPPVNSDTLVPTRS